MKRQCPLILFFLFLGRDQQKQFFIQLWMYVESAIFSYFKGYNSIFFIGLGWFADTYLSHRALSSSKQSFDLYLPTSSSSHHLQPVIYLATNQPHSQNHLQSTSETLFLHADGIDAAVDWQGKDGEDATVVVFVSGAIVAEVVAYCMRWWKRQGIFNR